MHTSYQKLAEKIEQAEHIVLFGHMHPDGDCIGSLLATYYLLSKLGKKVSCYTPDAPAPLFSFLPQIEQVQTGYSYDRSVDLCIFLDCATKERAGSLWTDRPDYFKKREVVVIDHHISNPEFGDINYVDAQASSTCEILTEIFYELYPKQLDADIATALLMGISTDTGNFSYENNSHRTFSAVLQLIELEARKEEIIHQIYRSNKLATIQFVGKMLERIEKKGHILYSRYKDTEVIEQGIDQEGVAEQFLYLFISIQHDGAFLMFKCIEQEGDPHLRCSWRAKGHGIDVSEAAGYFGGGGHKHAAGMRIELQGENDYQHAISTTVAKADELITEQLEKS